MRSLVVIPTFNEAQNIVTLAREVLAQDPSLDVLVIDDNSPDGTADRVQSAMKTEPRLYLLQREGKLGLGSAYLAGFRFALDRSYERVFTMDGDWSHHPRYIRPMLRAMADHDMVIGSRYIPGGGISNWGWHRRLLSAFANLYTRLLLRLPLHDCTSGFRCYSGKLLEAISAFEIRSSGYSFLEEMAWHAHRAGLRIAEVPIIFENRHAGISKIDRIEILKAAWHVLSTALRPPHVPRQRR